MHISEEMQCYFEWAEYICDVFVICYIGGRHKKDKCNLKDGLEILSSEFDLCKLSPVCGLRQIFQI